MNFDKRVIDTKVNMYEKNENNLKHFCLALRKQW